MKEDIKLIRAILVEVVEAPPVSEVSNIKVEGYDQDTIAEHVDLLYKGGFIEAKMTQSPNAKGIMRIVSYEIRKLTPEGQAFAKSLCNDTIWSRIQKAIGGRMGEVELSVIRAMTKSLALELGENLLKDSHLF